MKDIQSNTESFEEHADELLRRFDSIIASFEPPEPLHVKKVELKQSSTQDLERDLIKVYEDEECIIYMERD